MFRSHTIRQVTCILTSLSALALFTQPARAEQGPASVAPSGEPSVLTADEVAKRATLTSPAADEKRHEVEAAKAQLDKTFYDFFPRLSWSASYARLSPVSSPSLGTVVLAPGSAPGPIGAGETLVGAPLSVKSLQNSTSFTGTLNVPLSDYVFRLVQARQSSKAQLESRQFDLQASERKAAYDARALYYDWVQAELQSVVAQQNLDLSRENLSHMRALAAADSASEADVARVEATLASSELVQVQAKNLAELQRERIRIVLHDKQPRQYGVGEDFQSLPPQDREGDDIEALTRKALQQRPELRALSLQARAYERQAAAARSKALPRLDASAQSQVANPNSRYFPQEDKFHTSWQVGISLSYAPVDTPSALSDAAGALAKASAADAQRSEMVDALRSDVVDAVLSHRNAVAGLESSARRLRAAETSYRARYQLFLADKATAIELTEAQTELFNARLDDARAKVSIRLARARIAYVSGE